MKAFTQGSVAEPIYIATVRGESVSRPRYVREFAVRSSAGFASAIDVDHLEAAADGHRLHGSNPRRLCQINAFEIRNQVDIAGS